MKRYLLAVLGLLVAVLLSVGGFAESSTSNDKARVEQMGKVTVTLSPDARIERGEPLKLPLGAQRASKTPTETLTLDAGHLVAEVPDAEPPEAALLVRCPRDVIAVVKRGRGEVRVQSGSVIVAAGEHDMITAYEDRWRPLRAEHVRIYTREGKREYRRLAPPEALAAKKIAWTSGGAGQEAVIQFEPLADAASYLAHVWEAEPQSSAHIASVSAKNPPIRLPALEPGNYNVELQAVDRHGIAGRSSEPVPLRLVGFELPPGAKLKKGRIMLGRQQRVRLKGIEGLEMSYDAAKHFVPAADSVGLNRGKRTTLHLREPATGASMQLTLAPLQLRAEIGFSPVNPVWPKDDIQVRIAIKENARPMKDVEVKPRVRINLNPVNVDWQRQGASLIGTVPKPGSAGPWVVRVEVRDARGGVIGRNFVEVASERSPH